MVKSFVLIWRHFDNVLLYLKMFVTVWRSDTGRSCVVGVWHVQHAGVLDMTLSLIVDGDDAGPPLLHHHRQGVLLGEHLLVSWIRSWLLIHHDSNWSVGGWRVLTCFMRRLGPYYRMSTVQILHPYLRHSIINQNKLLIAPTKNKCFR